MRYRSNNQDANTTYVVFRVTPDVKTKIETYAGRMGVSSAEFLRRAVHDKMISMDTDPVMDKVYDALEDPEYIAKLKEKLKED